MRKKPQPITLPGLIHELGAPNVARLVGCSRALPYKWFHGQRPGWRNVDKLMELALAHGFVLTLAGGGR